MRVEQISQAGKWEGVAAMEEVKRCFYLRLA
jgi:hypothetical protein